MLPARPYRRRHFRTLSLLCDDEPLSDSQLKAYQSKLQEYRNFLDSVVRLALCGNVCVTEEAVTIGEHGLLTGEALNALQHAGAISVYNTLQQNNWEFPVPEDGEVAVVKSHVPIPDEFLDSEKPVRPDWPAVHISECFIEGEKAKLHGSVRPLRTFLPPTIVFRNAADVEEDIPETDSNSLAVLSSDPSVEVITTAQGIVVRRTKTGSSDAEYIPLEDYFFGREEGNKDYVEEKGDFRFKCAVCQRMFYSNIKLMSHILGHVDEASQAGLSSGDATRCQHCEVDFQTVFDLHSHVEQQHGGSQTTVSIALRSESSQPVLQRALGDVSTSAPVTTEPTVASSQQTNPFGCRICGKEACDEFDLAQHLQTTHRHKEMPYVCRLCLFRSSLFEDILDHFKKVHDNSNHLLCTYCLRIFTPSDARAPTALGSPTPGHGIGQTQVYLQHLRIHQIEHQIRPCPSCKLNFTNKSDYQIHRRLDHKGTRSDARDESMRTESYEPTVSVEEHPTPSMEHAEDTRPRVTLMNVPEASRTKTLNSINLPYNIDAMGCLECDQTLGSANHRRYLSCSMCRFGTFCASGYSRHLSQGHVYVSGTQSAEPNVSNPLVRPVYFDWMAEELRQSLTSKSVSADEEMPPAGQTTPAASGTGAPSATAVSETDVTDLLAPSTEQPVPEVAPTQAVESEAEASSTQLGFLGENPWDIVAHYMTTRLDARCLACSHCAATNLNGNSLACHLFEECGTNTATLNPNPELVKAREQRDEEERLRRAQQLAEQAEMDILFESTESNTPGHPMSSEQANTTAGDMVMITPDQYTSYGMLEAQADQTQLGNQLITQAGAAGAGTTIDVTDATGQVVQQFIIPEDLQLEEGQTLVVIHDEEGQPQLAIVNQADLMDPNNPATIVETEGDTDNTMLMYTTTDDQMQEAEILPERDEEKENRQFTL